MNKWWSGLKVKTIRHQKLLERFMASSTVLYSFVATFVVWRELSQYGVNPVVFFVVDVLTSWPYGIATTRIVINFLLKEWKAVRKWTLVAGLCFITPQVYVLVTARRAPRHIYEVVLIISATMIFVAIISLVLQIRQGRRSRSGVEN